MLWWCTRQKHDLVFSFSASFSLFYHCVLILAILLVSSCFPGSETPIPNLTQKRYSWSTLLHWISERKWIYEELWTRCFPTLTIQSDWDKHSSQTSYESRKTVIVIWIRWTHWWIALFFFSSWRMFKLCKKQKYTCPEITPFTCFLGDRCRKICPFFSNIIGWQKLELKI